MYMAACKVVGMPNPTLHVHLLLTTNDNFLAGILCGYVSAFSVHVCHHYDWSVGISITSHTREVSQKGIYSFRITCILHNITSQVWNCEHNSFFPVFSSYGYHQVVVVNLPFSTVVVSVPCASHVSPYLYIMARKEGARSFKTTGGVVIARCYDNLHLWRCLSGVSQKLIIGRLGSSRRIAIVEHIACYKKSIGLLFFNYLKKPF